jgi:hypothetical protein
MSQPLLGSGDDHPEAAAKNLSDASVLYAASRPDGAAYLAGYVVESSLKSLLLVDLGPNAGDAEARRLKHQLGKLSAKVLQLAALPSSRTARYAPKHKRLKNEREVPWDRRQVERALGKDWDVTWGAKQGVSPPADSAHEMVDYLVEVGIFRDRSDGRIDVPDLFLAGLGLKRKGGVVRG